MPKPGLGFSVTFRYPRPTLEQREWARKTIATWLRTLGSDGTTFRPGSLLYIAVSAGIQTGNGRLDPSHRIDVLATLPKFCEEVHRGVQQGKYVYHLVDGMFYDLFLGSIQEEDERFDAHGSAVHVAFEAFSTVLNQDADWINRESEILHM